MAVQKRPNLIHSLSSKPERNLFKNKIVRPRLINLNPMITPVLKEYQFYQSALLVLKAFS